VTDVRVTARGAERWRRGHPWIHRTELRDEPGEPGLVRVRDQRGKLIGQALYSPSSEIRLRLLEPSDRPVNAAWWRERVTAALALRTGIDATAYRVVHAEGDGLPSLIVDRYDRWLVAQLLSAGLETQREEVIAALVDVLRPDGVLLRHDAPARRRERLPEETIVAYGAVPQWIEVREGSIRYLAAPWNGQKTGAFLDQRENRRLAATFTPQGARSLDCFAYHGSFALHLATRSTEVVALDSSAEALERGAANARLNGFANIVWREGDAFQTLRAFERARERFDTIVLDPPPFAKTRSAVPQALRGYHEINLRAMRLLAPGGHLLTASCSFHVHRPEFLAMLAAAATDSGRSLTLEATLGQARDHPEILTIPETGYLKGALVRAGGGPPLSVDMNRAS
jgi:23S rRNA (cytosine1962-C5)-methyltransferase